ncbi:MAG: HDOD domain-containing protein [Proteobacteria bacterium]|nr:HDOD domain-containing protein [Pseudomonadota bacterium]
MSVYKKILDEIDNLKPIPAIVNQILEIIEEDNFNMEELSEVIQFDPLLTGKLLKVCNSAYYSLNRQIESVQDAISVLGLDEVINIVLLKSGAANLQKNQAGYDLNEGELWKHAVSSALIAKNLADKKEIDNKQMIFTSALLKDIGKIILNQFVGDSFPKIMNLVDNKGFSFMEAEKKIIGVNHAELGEKVAKIWGFSSKMIEIIGNHHLSKPSKDAEIETYIVYIADNICMMMGIGIGADGLAYRFHEKALKALDISSMELQDIIADFGENYQQVENLLKI